MFDGRHAGRRHGVGVRQPDLHRRRRAVPDGHPARPRDHQPVRARPGAVRRRRSTCSTSRSRSSASTGAIYTDQQAALEGGTVLAGTTWQVIVNLAQAERRHDRRRQARRGRHRVVRHVDALVEGGQPQLHEACGWTGSPRRGPTPRSPSGSARRRATRCRAALTADPDHCAIFHAEDDRRTGPTSGTGRRRPRTASTVAPTSSARRTPEWVDAWTELRADPIRDGRSRIDAPGRPPRRSPPARGVARTVNRFFRRRPASRLGPARRRPCCGCC